MTDLFTQAQWFKAKRDIDKLRADFPDASNAKLLRQVIKSACIKAGATGAGTTAVALLPGLGKMLAWAVSLGGDAAMTSAVQRDAILQVFAINNRQPTGNDHAQILQWLGTVGVGGIEIAEQVGGSILKRFAKRVFGKVFQRGLPLAEVMLSAITHMAGTYAVVRKADHYCRTGAELSTLDALSELDPRRVRNWMMMSFGTQVDDDQPKTVKDALKHVE